MHKPPKLALHLWRNSSSTIQLLQTPWELYAFPTGNYGLKEFFFLILCQSLEGTKQHPPRLKTEANEDVSWAAFPLMATWGWFQKQINKCKFPCWNVQVWNIKKQLCSELFSFIHLDTKAGSCLMLKCVIQTSLWNFLGKLKEEHYISLSKAVAFTL